ncbi:MAG: pentapeptide repeat-containing protein, partial [Planctomycetaceae bacterium]|nr:pentapeptide repeat-containing protein [Planctomycetaceae bacterium]
MDRDEALRLLKGGLEGAAEWNGRREAGEEIPDLHGADLRQARLGKTDLRQAHLGKADLR